MGKIGEECNLDFASAVAERARALHRVVRAMHDGHCPRCGHLGPAETFVRPRGGHRCPNWECGFTITPEVAKAALAEFQPYLQRSVAIFEEWLAERAAVAVREHLDQETAAKQRPTPVKQTLIRWVNDGDGNRELMQWTRVRGWVRVPTVNAEDLDNG